MAKQTEITPPHLWPPHLWIVLSRCHHALRQAAECSISGTGLVLTDFMVLEALLHKGPLTITEIQKKALLATGSMTAAVDRVERKGLIVRRTTSTDRRARVLELTDAGRTLIEKAFAQHASDLESIMSVLSNTEKEQLYRLTRKLGLAAAEAKAERETAQAATGD
ncbi:MarR family winged helix-turn-helix transcriptional regulator [Acidicapsa dinghuensis]|uniref:MarR family winged helix-turn-helix transcriptional regulator n=1 Tax=Acidicapsa dinghuensis TaxID=2218256 RepID=A0ABW1E8V1_9BACT|nr:MarR family winged helix-turn-helix transcriptional regulator [Acidicapsa dinghuensis]